MGFSVSGATVVVYVGLLVSAAVLYPAVSQYAEERTDAVDDGRERALDRQNAALGAANATYNASADRLVVTVTNSGTTSLAVDRVDLLLDGEYHQVTADDTAVEGDGNTAAWLGGERLRIEILEPGAPGRVVVVTGPGLSVATTVEVS
jgi:flagellar protein FlaF